MGGRGACLTCGLSPGSGKAYASFGSQVAGWFDQGLPGFGFLLCGLKGLVPAKV